MKRQERQKLGLDKLIIARIDRGAQININGGDCLPTEPTWYDHPSVIVCPTELIP